MHLCIKRYDPVRRPGMSIFDERKYPIGSSEKYFASIPGLEEVTVFLEKLVYGQELDPEVAVMGVMYIDRFIASTKIEIVPWNWRRVILAAFLVAHKVWEESSVWNADFSMSFPYLDVVDINRLEMEFLIAVSYDLSVTASVYAMYYFALRSVTGDSQFPIKPLDRKRARRIDAKSKGMEEFVKSKKSRSLQFENRPSKPHFSVEQMKNLRA